MKKTYTAPKLNVHGSIESLTQQTKTIGSGDGVVLVIPGVTPAEGVPIGGS